VEEAAKRFAPNVLCGYLFDLAQAFNVFYQKFPILKAEGEEREMRLFLTEKTGDVVKRGLELLGIQAPDRM
jgi:arginyl-tRNA synthetase